MNEHEKHRKFIFKMYACMLNMRLLWPQRIWFQKIFLEKAEGACWRAVLLNPAQQKNHINEKKTLQEPQSTPTEEIHTTKY